MELHPQNFSIAGSAKLGFSLSPSKLGKKFDEGSDIDIILVSERLFNDIWEKLVLFRESPDYSIQPNSKKKACKDLIFTIFFGHFKLQDLSSYFDFAKDWWMFFNALSTDEKYGPRQINAALFKNWACVDSFYERSLRDIKHQQNEV